MARHSQPEKDPKPRSVGRLDVDFTVQLFDETLDQIQPNGGASARRRSLAERLSVSFLFAICGSKILSLSLQQLPDRPRSSDAVALRIINAYITQLGKDRRAFHELRDGLLAHDLADLVDGSD